MLTQFGNVRGSAARAHRPTQTAEQKKAALEALRKLVDAKVELKVPANDGLLTQHVGPLEQRARKRLEADNG